MDTHRVQLLDSNRVVLAEARVADEGGHFGGSIDLKAMPAVVRRLFEEFEEVVNDQLFAVLDKIQEKVAALAIRARFEDGTEVGTEDLQIFPDAGECSFRQAGSPVDPELAGTESKGNGGTTPGNPTALDRQAIRLGPDAAD